MNNNSLTHILGLALGCLFGLWLAYLASLGKLSSRKFQVRDLFYRDISAPAGERKPVVMWGCIVIVIITFLVMLRDIFAMM